MLAFCVICHDAYVPQLEACLRSLREAGAERVSLVLSAWSGPLPPAVSSEIDAFGKSITVKVTSQTLTPGQARNLALRSLDAPWTMFLDADVTVTPSTLKKALEILPRYADDVGALCTGFEPLQASSWGLLEYYNDINAILVKSTDRPKRLWQCADPVWAASFIHEYDQAQWPSVDTLAPKETTSLQGFALIVRSDLVRALGFDERLQSSEDRDFAARVASQQKKMFFEPRLCVRHNYGLSRSTILKRKFTHGRWGARMLVVNSGSRSLFAWDGRDNVRYWVRSLLSPSIPFSQIRGGRTYLAATATAYVLGCIFGHLEGRHGRDE